MRNRVLRIGPPPTLAVELTGQGPLVVFLHGIGGNRGNWRDQLNAVGDEFTGAAWDARGYGDSDDYDGALQFRDFADDLLRLLDSLGATRAHLVGVSMGGRIALDFYARTPDRVATLTLADTSAGNTRVASAEEVERFLAIRQRPLLGGRSPRDIAPDVVASLIGPGTAPEVRARMIDSIASLHRDSYLKTLDTVTRHTAFSAFENITVPTLVIVGEHDQIATPEYAQQMAGRIPGARFAVVAGGSHIANMDRPLEFNRLLLEFLREHRARGDSPSGEAAAPDAGRVSAER